MCATGGRNERQGWRYGYLLERNLGNDLRSHELLSATWRIADLKRTYRDFRVVPISEVAASLDWLMTAGWQTAPALRRFRETPASA